MQPEDAEQRQTMFEEVEPPRPHSVFESPQHGSQQASLDGSVQAPAEASHFPTSSSTVRALAYHYHHHDHPITVTLSQYQVKFACHSQLISPA